MVVPGRGQVLMSEVPLYRVDFLHDTTTFRGEFIYPWAGLSHLNARALVDSMIIGEGTVQYF